MAQFSRKERLIASVLSATPGLKSFLKKLYIKVNYIIYRKGYKKQVLNLNREINIIEPHTGDNETFFGYYDKSPENQKGLILFNETENPTSKRPGITNPIWINIINRHSGDGVSVADSFSYNWQQGCRAQWISDDRFIYNFYNGESRQYQSAVYSLKGREVIRIYDMPVQDSFHDKYFLSINYQRIMRLRPDYGYRNLPLPDDTEMQNLSSDGIWKVDLATGQKSLAVSLNDIVNINPKLNFNGSLHKVNHVMISPDGEKFIFIHRWYHKGRRFDRLLLYKNNKIKVLADDSMVSHMCWINNDTVFGYLQYGGKAGFYFIDINSGKATLCEQLNSLNNGDGHPSCCKDWIVIDSYPDKSRVQHLTLFNYCTKKIIPILELFHPLKYQNETRCDLHPRFSPDGKRIYFDTVFTGKRRLAYIDVSEITQ